MREHNSALKFNITSFRASQTWCGGRCLSQLLWGRCACQWHRLSILGYRRACWALDLTAYIQAFLDEVLKWHENNMTLDADAFATSKWFFSLCLCALGRDSVFYSKNAHGTYATLTSCLSIPYCPKNKKQYVHLAGSFCCIVGCQRDQRRINISC